MRLTALLIILLNTISLTIAQSSSKDWKNGYLVHMNNDTIYGDFIFDWKLNTLGLKNADGIKVFTGRKMYYLEFYKSSKSTERRFFVLPYPLNSSYETPTIFELLVEGNLSLLARTHFETRVTAGSSFILSDRITVREFFFLKQGENIKLISGKKSEIFQIMSDYDESVKDYMKANKIKLIKETDLIKLTEHYNSESNNLIN